MYTKTGNLRLVQKINRSLVLNLIKEKSPISRADISKITKLTRSTVSSIVDYLIKKGLIKEVELTSSGMWLKAILLFTPIFLPIAVNLGLSPIHFGITMLINLTIGLVTPPVGTVLFVGLGIAISGWIKLLNL